MWFEKPNGDCVKPPTKADHSPCCMMKMWQPNYAGFYYDNCSAKCVLRPGEDVPPPAHRPVSLFQHILLHSES